MFPAVIRSPSANEVEFTKGHKGTIFYGVKALKNNYFWSFLGRKYISRIFGRIWIRTIAKNPQKKSGLIRGIFDCVLRILAIF